MRPGRGDCILSPWGEMTGLPAIYMKLTRQWRLRPIEQKVCNAMYWCLPSATLLPSYYLVTLALPSND